MNVAISARAERDLRDIGRFISQDSPARAASFVFELRNRCATIGERPRSFPLVPDAGAGGVRKRTFRAYLIFFRIGDEGVEILSVIHAARDWQAADAMPFPP